MTLKNDIKDDSIDESGKNQTVGIIKKLTEKGVGVFFNGWFFIFLKTRMKIEMLNIQNKNFLSPINIFNINNHEQ